MSLLSSPIEIVEKILSHLFRPAYVDPTSSTIPSSSLKGRTSILAVSKDIRALALPLFWRTVVVSKNRHWKDLFGKGRGLLAVDGEEAEKRRGWLRNVVIAVNASFFEDGTFGTDFACSSPISVLRGGIHSLQLVAVVQDGAELSNQIGNASSDRLLSCPPPPKPSRPSSPNQLNHASTLRTRSLLLSLHVGDSLRFILRSLQPNELRLPLADWIFVEDRERPYLLPIRINLRPGSSVWVVVDWDGFGGCSRKTRSSVP